MAGVGAKMAAVLCCGHEHLLALAEVLHQLGDRELITQQHHRLFSTASTSGNQAQEEQQASTRKIPRRARQRHQLEIGPL